MNEGEGDIDIIKQPVVIDNVSKSYILNLFLTCFNFYRVLDP